MKKQIDNKLKKDASLSNSPSSSSKSACWAVKKCKKKSKFSKFQTSCAL